MTYDVEIKGGADDFAAAVIGVVLDRIAMEEAEARKGNISRPTSRIPAWVRALPQERPGTRPDWVYPE